MSITLCCFSFCRSLDLLLPALVDIATAEVGQAITNTNSATTCNSCSGLVSHEAACKHEAVYSSQNTAQCSGSEQVSEQLCRPLSTQ